jgi:tape measure domain-containing protein
MADSPDVKDLLLRVDATTELLRRNLDKAQAELGKFQQGAQKTLDATDKGFAQLGQGLDRIAPAIARTNAQIGSIGAATKRVQMQVEASSNAMATALERTSGALAAAFSVEKVKEYADAYTRFTNSIRVAGVEGAALGHTQDALFQTAQQYGVSLESIGELYGRAAQAAHGLGASQGDVLKFSNAVAAAVKIGGGSAEQAKDSILQLGQALETGNVRSQEFNSITQGLYPLLQAVARVSDQYGGSVQKVRQAMLDGKLASSDFFADIVKAEGILQQRATSANLTIGASLTILNNALGRYIGQSDAGLSATERFGQGVKLLADNLDTVLPAIVSIGAAYGVLKVGNLALDGLAAALGRAAGADADVARQVLLGNAQFIDRTAITARAAVAAQELAAAEVTAIEETIAARRAEQLVLRETIAEEQALIAERRAQATFAANSNLTTGGATFGTARKTAARATNDADFAADRLAAARARQALVDAEVAEAEAALTGATVRSAVATEAATVATAAATFGARAAAAATALFAGAMDLLTGALPLLAIAGVVAAIIHFRNEAAETTKSLVSFDEQGRQLSARLSEANASARSAAGGIAQVGSQAASATGKMLAFAGAVGEAAQKLHDLAAARRREQVLGLLQSKQDADRSAADAEARIEGRRFARNAFTGRYTSSDPEADARDQRIITEARRRSSVAYTAAVTASQQPLESRLAASERNGGVDVPGELARLRNDLRIAQAGSGSKSDVNKLKAQVYQLTQYQAYRKAGLSDETARTKSNDDAERLRAAGEQKIAAGDAKTGAAASRRAAAQARAAQRRDAAAVRDDANDTRAYEAALRQDNDKIAAAHADLTNSAVERAQIERDRIEADRKSRNDEIAEQAKAGRFGDPAKAAQRVKTLQDANDRAAKAQTDVVDLKERREQGNDAAALAEHRLGIERDMLSDQSQLADTAEQRKAIELRLLDLQKREERLRLDRVLAPDSGASEGDRKIAQLDSDTLDERYATKGAAVAAQNAGPLEQYRRQLAGNVGDMGRALEGVKADGIKGVEDGLLGLVSGTETAASAFKRMATSIVADLARIAIEKGILTVIGLPLGLAGGGKIPGRADGGRISGPGSGTSDSILALVDGRDPLMVSNGESIVTAQATERYWPLIDAMNKGKLRRLAGGGRIGPAAVFRPAVPDMTAIGAAQRAAMPVQIIHVITDKTPLFDTHVVQLTAPMSQAAVYAGAEQARQNASDEAYSRIPT